MAQLYVKSFLHKNNWFLSVMKGVFMTDIHENHRNCCKIIKEKK